MRLFSNKRVEDIFNLISQKDMTQSELAKKMDVSTRTIRNDLKELRDILSDFDNSLIHNRKTGFSIHITNEGSYNLLLDKLKENHTITRSIPERRRCLLIMLLRQDADISLVDLELNWFISIYTLRNDIAVLKRYVALYKLRISSKGSDNYRLSGSEIMIRRCIYDQLLRSRKMETYYQELFNTPVQLASVKKSLSHYFVEKNLDMSDVNLRFFTLMSLIAYQRIYKGHLLLDYEFSAYSPYTKAIAQDIIRILANDSLINPIQSEIDYISMALVAFCPTFLGDYSEKDKNDVELAIMNHYLSYISSSWFCKVNYDQISTNSLLNHIKSMRFRVNNAINISNPLIQQIKRNYPLMYEMTISAFSELDHLFHHKISDDEIGYLVMYIGAILEDSYNKNENNTIKAIIISDQGIASTRIACQKITQMYPNIRIAQYLSVAQYKALSWINEDIVISLVNIEEKNRPLIILPPLPEAWQLANIKYLLAPKKDTSSSIRSYFSSEQFFIFEKNTHTKESLINFLSEQLELKNIVNEQFLISVLDRESRASTLLDNKIAIPHPIELVALKTLVSIAIFPDSIEWDHNKKVKVVFLLAISENSFIDSMRIYDYLTNILDDKIIEDLSKSKNYLEFMEKSTPYFGKP